MKFVDTSLLQVSKSDWENSSISFNTPHFYLVIHQYNPFKNRYITNECKSQFYWPTNNLQNLHGYEINVDMKNDRPFAFLMRNITGHVVRKGGSEVHFLTYIAKGMNFKIRFIPYTGEDSYLRFDKNKTCFGHVCDLINKKAEMLVNHRPYSNSPENNSTFEHTYPVIINEFCPIVPLIPANELVTGYLVESLLISMVVTVLIVFTARWLKFDRDFWTTTNVFYTIIGYPYSIEDKIKTTAERIIFVCLTIIFVVYSITLFNGLIDIKVKTYIPIKKLSDILKVQLIPYADYAFIPFNKILSIEDDSGYIHNLTMQEAESDEECLEALVKYKNVTCIMGKLKGKASVSMYNFREGKPVMKLMKECLWTSFKGMVLPKGSPYLRGINEKLMVLQSNGLVTHMIKVDYWILARMNSMTNFTMKNLDEPWIRRKFFINIILSGYLIGMIMFVLEICIDYVCGLNIFMIRLHKIGQMIGKLLNLQ